MKKSNRPFWSYVKKAYQSKLYIRNFIICWSLIVSLLVVVCFSFYRYQIERIENDMYGINSSAVKRVSEMIDSIIFDVKKLAVKISLQNEVQQFLLLYSPDEKEEEKNSENILNYGDIAAYDTKKDIENTPENTFSVMAMTHEYIDSIYLYSQKNKYVYSENKFVHIDDFRDNNWYDAYLTHKMYDSDIVVRRKNDMYPLVLTFVHPLYLDDKVKIGAVVVNIDIEKIGNMLKSEELTGDNIILVNKDDEMVIYSDDYHYLGKKLSDITNFEFNGFEATTYEQSNKIISFEPSKNYALGYILMTSVQEKNARQNSDFLFLITIFIISVVLGTFPARIVSNISVKPIKQISSIIRENNNSSENDNLDEMEYIIESIKNSISSNVLMGKKLEEQLALLNKYQAYALQVQINPHFIYNTLEVIKFMAIEKCGGINEVSETIEILGDLFRKNLDIENKTVHIYEEIENAKQYVSILNIRYSNCFCVEWDIDDSIINNKMLKLSLQPIIENCVCHGLAPKSYKGKIQIKAYSEEEKIVFSIKDDGVGIDKETLERLKMKLITKSSTDGEFLGLCNTCRRLKIVFGEESSLMVDSIIGEGTVVKLIFPKKVSRN